MNLKELYLNDNKLSTLPGLIGNLVNLQTLELNNNELSLLMESISNLVNLQTLELNNNELSLLMESISNLQNLQHLRLYNNPLSLETTVFLVNTLPNIAQYNMASHDAKVDYNIVLAKLHKNKDEIKKIHNELSSLGSTSTYVNGSSEAEDAEEDIQEINKKNNKREVLTDLDKSKWKRAKDTIKKNTLSASDVLKGFLEKIPLQYSPEFHEGAKLLIASVIDAKDASEKKSSLYRMAKTLGDCATPLKDALVQAYIEKYRTSELKPEGYDSLIARRAFESEVVSRFRNKTINGKLILRKNEEIEQVQGLVNTLFLKGALTNPKNKCKILFSAGEQPDTLQSITAYPDFAFSQVSDYLSEEFAKLCCKVDEKGNLLKNKEGNYYFSIEKYRSIVEKYYIKGLKIESPREIAICACIEKIGEEIQQKGLELYYKNAEVTALLDFNKQEGELREELSAVFDSEVENTANEYFNTQATKIKSLSVSLTAEAQHDDQEQQLKLSALADSTTPKAPNTEKRKAPKIEENKTEEQRTKKRRLSF